MSSPNDKSLSGEAGRTFDAAPLLGRDDLGYSASQNKLAEAMAEHFGQRFGFVISPQWVHNCLCGKFLPKHAVFPPTMINRRFDNNAWADWMLRTYDGRKTEVGDPEAEGNNRRKNADLAYKENMAGLARIKLEKAEAKYVLREAAQITRRSMLRTALLKIQRGHENEDTKARAEWLASKLSTADLIEWRQFDMTLAKSRVDAIYDDFANHIDSDPETGMSQDASEE